MAVQGAQAKSKEELMVECFKPTSLWKYNNVEECLKELGITPMRFK
ncbi:MAG: hypothetical protein NO126_01165 [Sulfolobales archaeon]|jgi:hypothetical protein|nr:hypothetical protein [Sulfolobales archaeon]